MSIKYENMMSTEFLKELSTEYMEQLSTEFLKELSTEYMEQLSTEFLKELSTTWNGVPGSNNGRGHALQHALEDQALEASEVTLQEELQQGVSTEYQAYEYGALSWACTEYCTE